MQRHVAAFTGFSGSGKTTLIVALIRKFVDRGATVGAIKHTHHPLNEENRGDTAKFRAAGAAPVILANEPGAVVFSESGTSRVSYAAPTDLLMHCPTDIVLVEGFKSFKEWPVIHVDRERRPTVEEALAILDRIWIS